MRGGGKGRLAGVALPRLRGGWRREACLGDLPERGKVCRQLRDGLQQVGRLAVVAGLGCRLQVPSRVQLRRRLEEYEREERRPRVRPDVPPARGSFGQRFIRSQAEGEAARH